MLTLKVFIIEHSNIFVGGAQFNKKMHLAWFRCKQNDEDFVSDEELLRQLGDNYIQFCSQLTYEEDRWEAKQRIFKRRFPERNNKSFFKMHSLKGVHLTFYLIDFFLFNLYYVIQ